MIDFSIVIPTFGRPRELDRCLAGIAALDYPSDRYNTVIVDDGSPDGVSHIVDRWRDRLRIELVVQANSGPACARNRGARHATGTRVAFIDDDCVPDPRWLTALAAVFEVRPDHLLGGRVVNALPHNPFAAASQDLVSYLLRYYDGHGGRTRLFTSNNMALRNDLFREAGGFDIRFPRAAGEDRDFCDRWISQGGGSTYVPDATVLHAHALTLRKFVRQHFEYGRAAAWFRRASAERRRERVSVEPLSFYSGMLRFPFNDDISLRALECSALLALSQLANASGFLYTFLSPARRVRPDEDSRRAEDRRPGCHD
jgi:GT2 family glycosyltransferase